MNATGEAALIQAREQFRRDANLKPAPGTIVAEFANGRDAMRFLQIKELGAYTITAGINLPYAVRVACLHPFSQVGANADGELECRCGHVLPHGDRL